MKTIRDSQNFLFMLQGFFVIALIVCFSIYFAGAAELNYQARLTDPGTGDPREGVFSMTFRLYDSSMGDTALWTETKDVPVRNGLFSTLLGDTVPVPATIFNGQDLWLGITVGTDTEATPRQPIVPGAYALHADDADSLDGRDSADFAEATHGHDGADISGVLSESTIPGAIARDAEVMPIVTGSDGPGSGVDADLLDGLDSTDLAGAVHMHDGADISGVLSESTIPGAIARDAEVMSIVTGGDGSGSGVDADLLDGLDSTDFVTRKGPTNISSASTDPALDVSQTGNGVAGNFSSNNNSGIVGITGLSSMPGAGVLGKAGSGPVTITGKHGVRGESDSGRGVVGISNSSTGVLGWTETGQAVRGETTNGSATAIYGYNFGSSGEARGVFGATNSQEGIGVSGKAVSASGSNMGVKGESASQSGIGVLGDTTSTTGSTIGVKGQSASDAGMGVYGSTSNATGTTYGVYGNSESSEMGAGVRGESDYVGVWGDGWRWGVYGKSHTDGTVDGYSIYGAAPEGKGYAGFFSGDVYVSGALTKSSGSFKIDHPLDPENKYLYHSFVESPDMMNVYNGTIVLDAAGTGSVELPDWFEALNRDFRYQLTAIGAPGPNLYVAEEVNNNHFRIAGGAPGLKVSWQVTGIRQDPYAEANRIPVEEDKPENERGSYLHPEVYGASADKGLVSLNDMDPSR